MDTPRLITVNFSVGQRILRVDKIFKHAPHSHLALLLGDIDTGETKELTISDYSAEEWSICYAIAKNKHPLYPSGDRIREVYQRYFDCHPTDIPRDVLAKECDIVWQSALDFLRDQRKGVFCAPSERVYRLLRPVAVNAGLVPFQLITLNDLPFVTCFDHGVPLDKQAPFSPGATPKSLYQSRKLALSTITRYGTQSWSNQDADSATTEEKGARTRGPRVAAPTPETWERPCSEQCILINENIAQKCLCFTYHGTHLTSGCIDHYLGSLIDLSSLDEVRFIRAIACTILSKRGASFVDLVPSVPNPHDDGQYLQCRDLLLTAKFDGICSLQTTLVGTEMMRMDIFLGFVKL